MKIVASVIMCALLVVSVGCGTKKLNKSAASYAGAVADYRGGKKLVVAFTASWASAWKLTEPELRKIDRERFDLCILDADADQVEIRKFGVDFLPTVALIEGGAITKRVQNLSSIEQLKDW